VLQVPERKQILQLLTDMQNAFVHFAIVKDEFGVTDGIVPHRLPEDVEEERRVLHVGITRGRHRVLVLGDAERRSPFLAELDGSAKRGALRAASPTPPTKKRVAAIATTDSPTAAAAETVLRQWRTTRAKADGVPAFVVLSDKHLAGIAARHPTSLAELRLCPGIGPAKLETYGEEILELLSSLN
jgi:DNA helicase-2/ATP-dependent DNA helicase PcrA